MDLTKHIEKAEDAARRKNFDGAIALYHQLLDLHPDSGRARAGLRDVLAQKAQKQKPSKLGAMLSGALPLLSVAFGRLLRQPKVVARSLERYLVHNPFHLGRNLQLGDALERAGCGASAIAVYRFAGEHASSAEAWKRAGALLYARKEVGPALEAYEKALELSPRDQEALKQRKNLAAEGALSGAGYEKARSSRDLQADKAEAKSLEREQRRTLSADEAREEIARVEERLASDPRNPALFERLGELQKSAGDLEAALDCYESALRYQPDSFDLREKIAALKSAAFDKKIAALEQRIAGGDEGARAQLEKLRREKRTLELADVARAVQEHPTDMPVRLRYGRLLLDEQKYDEAIAELQRAVNDPRCRVDALVALGQCFFKKGVLDLAAKQLEKALESLPGMNARSKEILYNLGTIAEKRGENAEARAHYARIYEADIAYRDVASKMEQLASS
ncbi:MAG: tetratricopeptide repeat protein [Planctomycetes bacterium]|nr:tetratricopeptide repeat protein [Planctomycetota bacterium]